MQQLHLLKEMLLGKINKRIRKEKLIDIRFQLDVDVARHEKKESAEPVVPAPLPDPARVEEFRLIGYENRMLKKEDFDDDKKDAGEIGAGHSVTALYEVVPADARRVAKKDHKSRYMTVSIDSQAYETGEMLTVRFRYKAPNGDRSKLITNTMDDREGDIIDVSESFRFATAVAQFGLLMRESQYKGESSYQGVLALAKGSLGEDQYGYRHEFVSLVEKARELNRETAP